MTISDFLQHEADLGSFAGAAWAAGTSNGIQSEGATGHAVSVPLRLPATTGTIWDCASITKPLVTTTLFLQAVAEGKVSLDDRVPVIPWDIRYRQLLTHTSGLTAWLPLYEFDDYVETIVAMGRECDPGVKTIYSDLNFVLLHHALESICGDYVELASKRIFEPLGITDEAMFRPAAALRPRIAATEWSQRFERTLAAGRSISCRRIREGLMWGETNDGNSHFHNGTAGNAGLFATARAVYRIAQSWINAELLPRELVAEATRNHTPGMSDARGLGWVIATPDGDACSMLSPEAYGHTGFTGTSVWIDPARDRIYVLLSNRVHPCAAPVAMQKVRGEFHRIADAGGHRG